MHADPAQVEQALVQILDNAAKYSPEAAPIRVTARADAHIAVLAVHDCGSGVTGEEKMHICERFFRGSRQTATTSGSGLGLWIANAFVTANGGELEVESEGADRGTTVSIRLPGLPEPKSAEPYSIKSGPAEPISAAPAGTQALTGEPAPLEVRVRWVKSPPVVLVIDDEIQIRRFLRAGFEVDGFSVTEAETGAEALRATVTLKPSDLVILDLGLPDMDGADVLERLRSWSNVPLIVLSVRRATPRRCDCLESLAPTITWSSRSAWPSSWRAPIRRCGGRCARRAASRWSNSARFRLNFTARAVFVNDRRLMLTPKEYRLLQTLAQHSGNVVTHQFPPGCAHAR